MSTQLLYALPLEVWSTLNSFLRPRETFQLFLTGDRLLTFILLNRSAITSLSIIINRHGSSLTPFITKQSHLRPLELEFCDDTLPSPLCPSIILSLPPTLTSISLTCSNAESAWLDDASWGSKRIIDYSNAMPLLTSISLDGETSWSDESLSWLPTNVTDLKLWKNTQITHAGMRQLPQTLLTLFLPKYDSLWNPQLPSMLPSSLESLFIRFKARQYFEYAPNIEGLQVENPQVHLLSHLRQLANLSRVYLAGDTFNAIPFLGNCALVQGDNGKLHMAFPPSSTDPSLTHLSIQILCSDAMVQRVVGSGVPLWPHTLTSLSIMTGRYIYDQTISLIHILPPNLSHFSLGYAQQDSRRSNPFAKFDHIISRDFAMDAPSLRLNLIKSLPKHLITLDLSIPLHASSRKEFTDWFASLPSTLTFLQLSKCNLAVGQAESHILEAEETKALPRGLSTLSLHRICLASHALSSLPPYLNRLFVYSIVANDDDSAACDEWNLQHGSKSVDEESLKESILSHLPVSVRDSHHIHIAYLLSKDNMTKFKMASSEK